MWQGVGACGRVWRHVAGVNVCGRASALGIDGDMWQGWGYVVGSENMWQVVGHAAGVVAGSGGMWQM